MTENTGFRSGFAALVGRPNVGKSTLLNALLGEKVSIVSSHAQTTRNKITGVWNGDNAQVVFLDTPGMHKPQSKLGEAIRQSTIDALEEVDLIVFLCAIDDPVGAGDRYILSLLENRKVPVILVLSKIDLIPKEQLLLKIAQYSRLYDFADIVPISAKTGDNLDELMNTIKKYLPEGPKYFPDDMVTDQPERNIAQEVVREKLLIRTRDEVPHAIGVYSEEFREEEGRTHLHPLHDLRGTPDAEGYHHRKERKPPEGGQEGCDKGTEEDPGRSGRSRPLGQGQQDWKNKDYILRELGYKEHK